MVVASYSSFLAAYVALTFGFCMVRSRSPDKAAARRLRAWERDYLRSQPAVITSPSRVERLRYMEAGLKVADSYDELNGHHSHDAWRAAQQAKPFLSPAIFAACEHKRKVGNAAKHQGPPARTAWADTWSSDSDAPPPSGGVLHSSDDGVSFSGDFESCFLDPPAGDDARLERHASYDSGAGILAFLHQDSGEDPRTLSQQRSALDVACQTEPVLCSDPVAPAVSKDPRAADLRGAVPALLCPRSERQQLQIQIDSLFKAFSGLTDHVNCRIAALEQEIGSLGLSTQSMVDDIKGLLTSSLANFSAQCHEIIADTFLSQSNGQAQTLASVVASRCDPVFEVVHVLLHDHTVEYYDGVLNSFTNASFMPALLAALCGSDSFVPFAATGGVIVDDDFEGVPSHICADLAPDVAALLRREV